MAQGKEGGFYLQGAVRHPPAAGSCCAGAFSMNPGQGEVLWTPTPVRRERANLTKYLRWLHARGRNYESYAALWQWSVDEQEAFWGSLWDYFGIIASKPYSRVLGERLMPGAEWFPGAHLNYAEHALRHERPGALALLFLSERRELSSMSWDELASQVRRLAVRLRELGLKRGDRVAAYLPNSPEAIIAMLATASIGAIWASCGPDFGPRGVLDRFTQLAPKLMFCVDGYFYGGKQFDRRPELAVVLDGLPSVQHVIYVRHLDPNCDERLTGNTIFWESALQGPEVPRATFRFEEVPFAHPLWILFSSGTTGLPKPIIHCHGGMILEQLKAITLQMDLHPGDRMFFFTTTGWMMWNLIASALLADVVPVLYDGNPSYPGPDALWSMVENAKVNYFGASPTYIGILQKAGVVPKERFDLSALDSLMLAGSPVTAEAMSWIYRSVKADVWAFSGSGGTDVCTGIVGGVVLQPVYAGEIQSRQLGMAAYAFNGDGKPVFEEVGEMVIAKPAPCMPVGFWGDPDGSRYRESYFDHYPGVWRHGDFFLVNARGGCLVLGRSDATLNRHGVRIGTAEVYRSLAEVTEIEDSLIVNLDLPTGDFFMPLFVKLREGLVVDDSLVERVRKQMKATYSARHIPDAIVQVKEIPYTLTGKKMEVPVRRILMGEPVEKAVNRSAMLNADSIDFFIAYAASGRQR